MDSAVAAIGPGVHAGSLVIFETTLPVGDTRDRFTPRLEAASGLKADADFFVAFSPERLFSGAALRNLSMYPKLVGGIGQASTARAAAFYDTVLDTEVVAMSNAEAAEFSKLADTTYRDVNVALANEFAGYAEGVPILVLGLTYRRGVKELAYSRALPLIERLTHQGAILSAFDPLLAADETDRCCATPHEWGTAGPFRAIVTQTGDPLFGTLDVALFPNLELVFDGRDSLRGLVLPEGVAYRGIGVPARPRVVAGSRVG